MSCYVIYVAYKFLNYNDYIAIANKFLNITLISLFAGVLEFILENYYHSLWITEASVAFLGKAGAQQMSLNERNGFCAMQAFTKEASMYSTAVLYSAFIALCMTILHKERRRFYIRYSLLALLLLLLNRSMSSYVFCFIYIIYCIYLNPFNFPFLNNKHTNIKIACMPAFLLLIGINAQFLLGSDSYFSLRLAQALQEFANYENDSFTRTSEGIRFLGISHCMSVFIDRPLLGVGIGCISCLSGIFCILSNIGILGFYSYIKVCNSLLNISNANKIFVLFVVVILPNLLLNDMHTMLACLIPFSLILTSLVINTREI